MNLLKNEYPVITLEVYYSSNSQVPHSISISIHTADP